MNHPARGGLRRLRRHRLRAGDHCGDLPRVPRQRPGADPAADGVRHHVHLHRLPQLPGRRGRSSISPCKACGGSGGVRRQKKVHIKVPAGIDNGQAISVRGQGDMRPATGAPPGTLIVGIHVDAPRPAAPGGQPHLPGPGGVRSTRPPWAGRLRSLPWTGRSSAKCEPGTQPGTTLRLRGKGVPVLNGRGRGDQYVTIRVEIPRNLNEAQKEALRKFAETMGEVPPSASEEGESKSVFHRRKKK